MSFVSSWFLFLVGFSFGLDEFSGNDSKTNCRWLRPKIQCQCFSVSHWPVENRSETRVFCRSLNVLTSTDSWSTGVYDRLTFDNPFESLTVRSLTFVQLVARTIHLTSQHFVFESQSFADCVIGQLIVASENDFGTIEFRGNNEIFPRTVMTKLTFASIDFVRPISERILSKLKIYSFSVENCKYFGFVDEQISSKSLSIVSILNFRSSIETKNLTEKYFPLRFDYEQMEQINVESNSIEFLNGRVFRRLEMFAGLLNLNKNRIRSIDRDAFLDLIFLKKFSISNNFLESISDGIFRRTTRLVELDLSFNRIRRLKDFSFGSLIHLEILHLNENPLEIIEPDAFFNLTRLKQIHLRRVEFIDPPWIWRLAKIHAFRSNDELVDLSDLAFCLLSKTNKNQSYRSSPSTCACATHYFSSDLGQIRLTGRCSTIDDDVPNENRALILRNFDDRCDYTLTYIECQRATVDWPKTSDRIYLKVFISIVVTILSVFVVFLLFRRLKKAFYRFQEKRFFLEQQRYFHNLANSLEFSSTRTSLSLPSTVFSRIEREISLNLVAPLAKFRSIKSTRKCSTNVFDDENHAEIDQIVPIDRY